MVQAKNRPAIRPKAQDGEPRQVEWPKCLQTVAKQQQQQQQQLVGGSGRDDHHFNQFTTTATIAVNCLDQGSSSALVNNNLSDGYNTISSPFRL